MRRGYSIIRGPLITEKAAQGMEKSNRYSFVVDKRANKIEIKKAVEVHFKVSVTKVNTVNMRGKLKRVRWQRGKTPDWKKAIVTLKDGDKIDYT
jgi:large subunit ribosomal protein L23